jgi:hypothetical protein
MTEQELTELESLCTDVTSGPCSAFDTSPCNAVPKLIAEIRSLREKNLGLHKEIKEEIDAIEKRFSAGRKKDVILGLMRAISGVDVPLELSSASEAVVESRENRLVQSSWQPIETAPRGGTKILLAGGFSDNECCIAFWKKGARKEGWWNGFYYLPGQPTHWMPLPDRPQEKSEEES